MSLTKFDSRQSVNRAALPMVGSAVNATLDSIFSAIDPEISKLYEDRNISLADGGQITYNTAGTSIAFTQNLTLHINSQVAGGTPTTISLGSTTRTLSSSGKMVYAVINRTLGTAVVTDDSSTLPAVTSSNQEVVLIAKRVDSADGTKQVYFRNGFSLVAGQTSRLSSPNTLYTSVANDATSGSNVTLAAFTAGTIRLTSGTLVSVSGIPAGTSGQILVLENQTGATININNDDAGASAANRIYTGTGAIVTMSNNASFMLEYDATATHWMVVGGTGSGSGSGGINYITFGDAEAGTQGWATYSNVQAATFSNGSSTITVGSTTGMYVGQPIAFNTVGTLPTNFTTGTTYFILTILGGSTFNVSATLGGAAVSAGSAGTGIHFARPLTPTSGTGGSVSGITFSASSSSPLRGNNSYLFTQANTPAPVTVTITNASPAVFTTSGAHNLSVNQLVWFTTTGTLPTGLSTLTPYYVTATPLTTTFRVSATIGGADINTSSAGSGTHTLNDDGDISGQGVSYDFTIDSADKAHALSVQADFNADTNFSTANGTTAPNSGGAGDSDLEFWIYDKTNAALISITPQVITAKGSNNYTFKGIFQSANNSTSYRLCVHSAKTSAAVTGYNFKFDTVKVGPQTILQGPPITDPVAYIPTFTGLGTVTGINFISWRDGAYLFLEGSFTTGTCTGVEAQVTLGFNGASANVTSLSTLPTVQVAGNAGINANATAQIIPLIEASKTYLTFGFASSTTTGLTKTTGTAGFVNATTYSINARVPIAGWSSTTLMSNDTDTRVVAARYTMSGTASLTTTPTILNFDTKDFDTHNAVTTGASWQFTAPVSGIYEVSTKFMSAPGTTIQRIEIHIHKNGVDGQILTSGEKETTNSSRIAGNGTDQIYMNAGDFFNLQANTTSGTNTINVGTTYEFISIKRLSGPSAIAATEVVSASYYVSANFAASTTIPVNFDTKEFDSHSAVTTSATAWKFIAPIGGLYHIISGNLELFGGATAGIELYKNGSLYRQIGIVNAGVNANANSLIRLIAGDFIDIRPSGSVTFTGGTLSNFNTSAIQIIRVGN